jgi:hypothetical protein
MAKLRDSEDQNSTKTIMLCIIEVTSTDRNNEINSTFKNTNVTNTAREKPEGLDSCEHLLEKVHALQAITVIALFVSDKNDIPLELITNTLNLLIFCNTIISVFIY